MPILNMPILSTQYASKFGKLSSGHRTGKGQFSFQSQRKAMPKNAQTTAQLHSSQWHPTPVLLPGKSHGRSLVGCSPWGHKESDRTGRLHFTSLFVELILDWVENFILFPCDLRKNTNIKKAGISLKLSFPRFRQQDLG